jgi:hypothetical protein
MSDTLSVSDFKEVLRQLGFLDKVNRIETNWSHAGFGANVRMKTNQMVYGFGPTEEAAVKDCIENMLKGKTYAPQGE